MMSGGKGRERQRERKEVFTPARPRISQNEHTLSFFSSLKLVEPERVRRARRPPRRRPVAALGRRGGGKQALAQAERQRRAALAQLVPVDAPEKGVALELGDAAGRLW